MLWQVSWSTEYISWLLVKSSTWMLWQVSWSTEHINWLLVKSTTCICDTQVGRLSIRWLVFYNTQFICLSIRWHISHGMQVGLLNTQVAYLSVRELVFCDTQVVELSIYKLVSYRTQIIHLSTLNSSTCQLNVLSNKISFFVFPVTPVIFLCSEEGCWSGSYPKKWKWQQMK